MSSTLLSDASNLFQRHVERDMTTKDRVSTKKTAEKSSATTIISTTEDEEMEPLPPQPNGTHFFGDKARKQDFSQYLDRLLSGVSPRWRNWIVRGIFSFVMITAFAKAVSMGPLVVSFVVLLAEMKCFHEIITIGYIVYKSHNLPRFRTLSWFFLFTSNYWLYGESLIHHFGFLMNKNNFLQPLVTYHRMISFLLYTSGFVGFVLSLKKTYYLKQFTLFGYTHITLMILVTSSHQMIQNICEGMIWFLFPVALITCNDIMAYVFGFFFGRTPLTILSPKKTWEGFIGGGISTLIFGFIFAGILCQYQFFVCPMAYDEQLGGLAMSCTPIQLFQKTTYSMTIPFSFFKRTLDLYPFQLHSLVLSLFASSIGPFGGFFASGFKRAFRIKDFADTIPGHGGFVVSAKHPRSRLSLSFFSRIDSIARLSWLCLPMFTLRLSHMLFPQQNFSFKS